ncbi:MAG: Gfo/Idh/MocA family oxidoreductase [Phycisphaerae bacterium]|nr:Gfo/Idh/MocA family oxidoreductase [Phycisphaerae bacterium]
MKKKTRVLVAGLGSIGRRHARLLSERQDVELTICDPVEEHRKDTLATLTNPAAATSDYPAALSERPDAVIIATPNHLHVPMGLQAVEAGADVLMEKPISDTLADARQLVAAAEKAGRFLQVGYMLRLDPGLQKLKTWIDAGSLGQLVGGRSMVGTYITLLNAKSPDRLHHPNSLIVDYTHELDFLHWLFGDVAAVSAAGAQLGRMELKPPPNVFQMILRAGSGALIQVHMDYVQFPQRRTLEVYGDRGAAVYDFTTGELKRFPHQREYQYEEHNVSPIAARWDDLFRQEHAVFLEARRSGRPPLVSGRDGLAAMILAETAIQAAREGCWVDVARLAE